MDVVPNTLKITHDYVSFLHLKTAEFFTYFKAKNANLIQSDVILITFILIRYKFVNILQACWIE